MSDNCYHNFGTFDDFGVRNDQKISHNMILMSKYKGQHGGIKDETRPNWARKVREMILFSVLCTVYCGRGCVSLESERGKELA